jgi:acyl-CoA thioester hydrolase
MDKPEQTVFDAPLTLYETKVEPEWVDYNGHMSEAYYVLVFGHTSDAFLDLIGMDADYRERNGMSLYTLEVHVSYLREAREGDPLTVTTQLLDLDHKRAHLFHAMRHGKDDRLLAIEEAMLLSVNSKEARSTPFPEDVMARLRNIREAHALLPAPEQAGRSIAIRH